MTFASFRNNWERWRLDNRTRIAAYSQAALVASFVARMLSFLLLFGCLGLWFMYQSRNGDYWVRHTFEVINAIRSLDKSLTEAERVQRNYLITGRRSSRESYVDRARETWAWFEQVRKLTRDNPSQQARLMEVESILSDKFGFLDEAVTDRRDNGFDAARAVIESGRGEVIIGRFNRMVAALDAEEYTLLDMRQRWQQWCATVLWMVLIGATARDIYIFWFLVAEMVRRRGVLAAADAGELGPVQPKGD